MWYTGNMTENEKLHDLVKYTLSVPLTFESGYAYPCMVSIVGSHNYGLATPESDIDMKIGYWPTFKQLYKNKFPMPKVETPTMDYTAAPIHHLVKHALKGNMNFMEPWLTEYAMYDSRLVYIRELLRKMFPMNGHYFVTANYGMAYQNYKKWHKDTGTLKYASHAIRCLEMAKTFINTGDIQMEASFSAKFIKQDLYASIEISNLYSALEDWVGKKLDNEEVLDKTKTPEYIRLKAQLDQYLMDAVYTKCSTGE